MLRCALCCCWRARDLRIHEQSPAGRCVGSDQHGLAGERRADAARKSKPSLTCSVHSTNQDPVSPSPLSSWPPPSPSPDLVLLSILADNDTREKHTRPRLAREGGLHCVPGINIVCYPKKKGINIVGAGTALSFPFCLSGQRCTSSQDLKF